MEKPIDIAGIPVAPFRSEEVLAHIDSWLSSETQTHLVTLNPEMVVEAWRNPPFHSLLREAHCCVPDGIGILWAAHYLSRPRPALWLLARLHWFFSLLSILFFPRRIRSPLPERITGTDLLPQIVRLAQERQSPLFFLGGEEGEGALALRNLSTLYPRTPFAGSFEGSPDPRHETEILARINESRPAILFVAYGAPRQEFWIRRNLSRMPSVRLAIGVGGAFTFHAGRIRRAPQLLRRLGLEWLWRLLRQPSRWGRIWRAAVVFPNLVFRLGRKPH